MFGLKNSLIRETIQCLQDPAKWNPDGHYVHGTKCIVTACFNAAVDRSTHHDCNHGPALAAIRDVIENRFGLSRGSQWSRRAGRDRADIIRFNDNKLTDHDDVMWVLRKAERITRPFWRGDMA